MPVDTDRRIGAARPVGRALSGQDRYDKEAVEGPPEGPLATRRQHAGTSLVKGKESPFAAKLRKLAGGTPPDGQE